MNKLTKILFSAIAIIIPLIVAQPAAALFTVTGPSGAKNQACSGLNLSTNANCSSTSQTDIDSIVGTVVSVLSFIVGVVAVIMLIIGGFRFITSSGDQQAAASARNTILYALVGLAVAALAEVLARFVFGKVSGL